jgi:predicted amidohydrolase
MKIKIATSTYQMPKHLDFNSYQKRIESFVVKAALAGGEFLIFPEYGSIELVSLMSSHIQKDLEAQLSEIQQYHQAFCDLFRNLAMKYQVVIIAPSFPVQSTFDQQSKIVNRAYVFFPNGEESFQEKNMMTRFENEEWRVSSGNGEQKIFEFKEIKFGISICYDIEFPDFSRELCSKGVELIIAPSCTEGLSGMNRVHIGARARALENQCYVVVSQTVGEVDYSEAIDKNTGLAAIYSTADLGFNQDGIEAIGELNQEMWLIHELDFEKIKLVRSSGRVFNFNDILKLRQKMV